MAKIVIHQKPTCTSCRRVYTVLKKNGDAVNYSIDPISKSKLKELLMKMDMPAAAILRTKEPLYKGLRCSEKHLCEGGGH